MNPNKTNLRKAQSLLEYTLLFITVAAAFMAMNLYMRRAVNARLHSIELEVNPPIMVQGGRDPHDPRDPPGRDRDGGDLVIPDDDGRIIR